MKTSLSLGSSNLGPFDPQYRSKLCWTTLVATCLLAGAGRTTLMAQSDDFNQGNDDAWTIIDLSPVGAPAERTFPDDVAGGKAYRIAAQVPPVPQAGPPRAVVYRSEVTYPDRFQVAVDFLDWDGIHEVAFGPVARLHDNAGGQNLALANINGYLLTFDLQDADLTLSMVSSTAEPEDSVPIAPYAPALLNRHEGPYRFVLTGWNVEFVGQMLLGQIFSTGDLNNPLVSVVANDSVHTSGTGGMLILDFTDMENPANWKPAYVTYDNYSATAPAANSLPPTVIHLSPRPGQRLENPQTEIQVGILDRDTYLDDIYEPGTIQLRVDGVDIPFADLEPMLQFFVTSTVDEGATFAGATVRYQPPNPFPAGKTITNRIVFRDADGQRHTNEWAFHSIALLDPAHAAPVGSGENPGFDIRLVQTLSDQPLANMLDRAKEQLYGTAPRDVETNTTANVINFTQNALPSNDGNFPDEATFPGIDPAGNTDDFALEALFYLELPVGQYTFGVLSDEGFELASGASPSDPNATVIGRRLTGSAPDQLFQFAVETAGLYPFRLIQFERGGGAHVELFSVNPDNPAERTLINDPAPGSIKAYRSVAQAEVTLEFASEISAGFVSDDEADVDPSGQTVTTVYTGATRFYRLVNPSSTVGTQLEITDIQIDGENVILTYDFVPVIP